MKKPIKDEYPDYTKLLETHLDDNAIKLNELNDVIANQTAVLTERNAELAERNAELAERNAELAELRKTNYKQTNQINKMGWQINNLAGQLHYQQPQFVKANLPWF